MIVKQQQLKTRCRVAALLLVLSLPWLSGCVGGLADTLSGGVLSQSDPGLVEDGLPAYLILIDGMILEDPEAVDLLLPAARLYSAYSTMFVDDEQRARRLAAKGLDYARRALCEELETVCRAADRDLDDYREALAAIDDVDDVPVLYTFATAWAGWVQVNRGDWEALADLPKIEQSFKKILALDSSHDHGNAHLYMGVLLTLRPAALGGRPEDGRRHFARAVELSQGRNLMVKVLYARHYARLTFDRELHDRLLEEVLAAEVKHPDLTLTNALAQQQARELLDSSDDYF